MRRELQLVRAIALKADQLYDEAVKLGQLAAQNLSGESGRRSQVTQLEAVANSAIKVSDVLDYVKRQTGKSSAWQKDELGLRLVGFLDSTLRGSMDHLQILPAVTDPAERQHAHLELIRAVVHQIAAHYEFGRAQAQPSGTRR